MCRLEYLFIALLEVVGEPHRIDYCSGPASLGFYYCWAGGHYYASMTVYVYLVAIYLFD